MSIIIVPSVSRMFRPMRGESYFPMASDMEANEALVVMTSPGVSRVAQLVGKEYTCVHYNARLQQITYASFTQFCEWQCGHTHWWLDYDIMDTIEWQGERQNVNIITTQSALRGTAHRFRPLTKLQAGLHNAGHSWSGSPSICFCTLWPSDLMLIGERGLVIDYPIPVPSLATLVSAVFYRADRETNRITRWRC